MEKTDFEILLDKICIQLTNEARQNGFSSSSEFEKRVRAVMHEHSHAGRLFKIDFSPHPQAFPDIAAGEYGIEVKFTTDDTWRTIGNSIQETQRIESVKYVYLVFGKMGGIPEVRWREYENSVIHVRTSHVPRFEVEVADDVIKLI